MPRRPAAPPVPPPRLILEAGPTAGARVVPLSRDVVVGRDASCDVVLDDPHVSARHARLRVRDGAVVVEDLGSVHGTTVNGRVVPSAGVPVSRGDRITFGAVQARVDDPWQRAAGHVPEESPRTDASSTPRHVILSCARVDTAFVRPLVRTLESAGHEVRVDTEDLFAGATWTGQPAEAIERSNAFVVVLSARSVASPAVVRAVHLAASRQVPIIPVEVRPVRIPGHLEYPLSGLHRIAGGSRDAERVAREVLKAVERGLPRRRRSLSRRRAALVLVAVLVALSVVLGTATVVTGAAPPWAFSVAPGATVERSLGIEVPATRAGTDSVVLDVGSVTEDWLPILRCRAVAGGVPVRLPG